jgi:hypothetical protein
VLEVVDNFDSGDADAADAEELLNVPTGTIMTPPNGLGANSTDGLFSTVDDSLSANGAQPGG